MKKQDFGDNKENREDPSSPIETQDDECLNPETPSETSNSSHNEFDFEKLRLSQDFSSEILVKKTIVTVPVRKPNRQEFVRIYPGENGRFQTCVLILKEDRETYLVDRSLWPQLAGEIIPVILFMTINRQGVVFLWPVRLPAENGQHNEWNRSAMEAAIIAESTWIRLAANMSLGAYEIHKAQGEIAEPDWPKLSLEQILHIAFKDRFIRTMNHPVIRRLRGEQ